MATFTPQSAQEADAQRRMEKLAIIREATLRYEGDRVALVFAAFVDDSGAADQWLWITTGGNAGRAAETEGTRQQFIDLLEAFHPKDIADLNGKPVWVIHDRDQNSIRYRRPARMGAPR